MILFALALAQASATPAPAPVQAGPPPEFLAAAQAFSGCLRQGVTALPANAPPTAGAQQVIAGCATQRAALDAQFDKLVGSPNVPAADRNAARGQYQQQMGQLPAQLAAAIGQRAAAPVPNATPTPHGR